MMHKLPFVKKFLLLYGAAVGLVLPYFFTKILFFEEKEIEYKHFNTQDENSEIVEIQENKNAQEKRHFIVLPKK